MRILLVENDPCARRWLASQALELGVELFLADDERAALGVVSRTLIDAALVDVASCTRRKSSCWHRLRRQLCALGVPLLTYSSVRQLEGEAARLGWRCSGFLPRPFHFGNVIWYVRIAQRKAAARPPEPGLCPAGTAAPAPARAAIRAAREA